MVRAAVQQIDEGERDVAGIFTERRCRNLTRRLGRPGLGFDAAQVAQGLQPPFPDYSGGGSVTAQKIPPIAPSSSRMGL